MNKFQRLALSWSVSRGRDTYGYNICRLDADHGGKRYKCMGGGYDMVGTVFGDWLQDNYRDRLVELAQTTRKDSSVHPSEGGRYVSVPGFYGMTYDREGDEKKPVNVSLDGACGIESMIRIAEAIGLNVERDYDRKGNTTGYFITDNQA